MYVNTNNNKLNIPLRRVRSFVKRDGRMTEAQRDALQRLWPRFGLKLEDGKLDFAKIFQREVPRILEIGFGSGRSLLAMAKQHPEEDYIGIEMFQPGIGGLLLGMELQQIDNIRVFYADAVEVLEQCISEESLDVVQIFFPDPWQKRKHHKRRLIQPEFISKLAAKLKLHGTLHLATDWEDYAKDMMRVLSESEEFINLAGHGNYADRSTQRPVITKFEERGARSGRKIWELQFAKC
jgi:tRNA (guanine-N7-)-methyltransferase